MSDKVGFEKRYRVALAAGVVVVALQVALFAWGGTDDADDGRSERSVVQLVGLPESDAPLADVAEVVTPETEENLAPRQADVATLAAIPSIPKLTAAMANAIQPAMFMENLEASNAEENPAATYSTVSDFLVASTSNSQPLRPIDDRPVSILAAIGGSGGIGIGAGGPHCKPARPGLFTRSPVVSGLRSRIGMPRL
jgi:hypothetical protein